MRNIFNLAITMIVLAFVTGCATMLTPKDLQSVRTVGIINKFPDTPNFLTIGTTVFNNEYAQINDPEFSRLLTDTVVRRLKEKGFESELITEEKRQNYQMIIELIPRDVYGIPGTYGFGIYQRSLFGSRMQANTYVALNITPFINGEAKCSACYLQSLMPLEIEELPPTWEELSTEEQRHAAEVLKKNIAKALQEILRKTGL